MRCLTVILLLLWSFSPLAGGQTPALLGGAVFPDSVQAPAAAESHNPQQKRPPRNHSLPFAVFMLLGALLAFVRHNHKAYLKDIYGSVFSANLAHRMYRENRFRSPAANLMLSVMMVAVMGMFAFLLVRRYGHFGQVPGGYLLPLCILCVLLVYGIRILMLKFIAFVVPQSNIFNLYAFSLNMYNGLLAIALLPFMMLLAFAGETAAKAALLSILCLVAGFALLRGARGVNMAGKNIAKHPFHFFLYLCAAEVAPILIIYKFIKFVIAIESPIN